MIYVLYLIHVVVSLFLILVVLLQQGKGADLSVFGGGATQAAFGARGTASLLHKLTVWGFVAFIATTISIGFMVSSGSTSSVMSDLPEQGAAEATTETAPAETEAVDDGV
jgi:preprotein translocase subunit SecG